MSWTQLIERLMQTIEKTWPPAHSNGQTLGFFWVRVEKTLPSRAGDGLRVAEHPLSAAYPAASNYSATLEPWR